MYSKVYVEITNICNKSCSFCPKTNRPKRRLSEAEFTEILHKIKPVTDYLYYHITGEPLMHPLLPRFIKTATSLGFKSAITTNGTLLDECGDHLLNSGVYKVNISLHSFEEGSDEAHASYIRSCLDFADKASKCGILVILRLWNRGVADTKNEATERMIHEKFGTPEQASVRGCRIRPKLHIEYADRFEWPDIDASDEKQNVVCRGLKDHFGILCDGTVVPCCLDNNGNIPLGNIFSSPLDEILNSRRSSTIRQGFEKKTATEELCRKCPYARRFKL